MIIAKVAVLILVFGISYFCYQHFRPKYHYTYIRVNRNVIEINEKDIQLRFDYRTNLFFYEHVLNYMLFDGILYCSVEMLREDFENEKTCIETCAKNFSSYLSGFKFDIDKTDMIKKVVDDRFEKFISDASLPDSKGWTISDRDFLEYKRQLRLMMLEIFREIARNDAEIIKLMKNKLVNIQAHGFYDSKASKKYKQGFCDSFNMNLCELKDKHGTWQVPLALLALRRNMKKNDFYHCVIDLTGIYLEGLRVLIDKIKTKKDLDHRKFINDYSKSVQDSMKLGILKVSDYIIMLKLCSNRRATLNLDLISILEFVATSGCSERSCRLISDSLKGIIEGLKSAVDDLVSSHSFASVDKIDVTNLIKYKIKSHASTHLLLETLQEHMKRNESWFYDNLANIKKFTYTENRSVLCFDMSFFDSLVGSGNNTFAASDVDTLLTFYNEKSRLIIDTCSVCKGKKADFCENCEKLKCHFGHICILYKHYKDLLERKNRLYYYQNIDEFVKYGKEDEEKELEQKRLQIMEAVRAKAISEPQNHSNIGEYATSGVTLATKSREYRTEEERNKTTKEKLRDKNLLAGKHKQ